MASTSETGHAINVAHWEKIISACKGYGTKYDPKKEAIKIPAMETLLGSSQQSLKDVATASVPFKKTKNALTILIEPLSGLCTQVLNALDSSEADDESVKDAKTYIRKIQGKRATPKKEDDPATPEDESKESISASQMSVDMRLDNFFKLIELLKGEPAYAPNEVELQTASLETYYNQLVAANKAVIAATAPLLNARIARDTYLYDKKTGIFFLQKDVKKYVKSVFKPNSPQFKQVSGLEFTLPR